MLGLLEPDVPDTGQQSFLLFWEKVAFRKKVVEVFPALRLSTVLRGCPRKRRVFPNVIIEWENRKIISEPLSVTATDDPVACAIYSDENDLSDQPG